MADRRSLSEWFSQFEPSIVKGLGSFGSFLSNLFGTILGTNAKVYGYDPVDFDEPWEIQEKSPSAKPEIAEALDKKAKEFGIDNFADLTLAEREEAFKDLSRRSDENQAYNDAIIAKREAEAEAERIRKAEEERANTTGNTAAKKVQKNITNSTYKYTAKTGIVSTLKLADDPLIRLIGIAEHSESAVDCGEAYNIVNGNTAPENADGELLSQWTLNEVLDWQSKNKNKAAGYCQVKPDTLKDMMRVAGWTGKEIFSPDLQLELTKMLIARRGFESYVTGKSTFDEFGKKLSIEFRGVPDPATGETYADEYKAGNNARVTVANFKNAAEKSKALIKNGQAQALAPPLAGRGITSNFGMRDHPKYKVRKPHKGIDIETDQKSIDFKCSANGVVVYKKDKLTKKEQTEGAGKYLCIRHSENIYTHYMHLESIDVKNGQTVSQGQILGKTGDTGGVTGYHLDTGVVIVFPDPKDGILKAFHVDPFKVWEAGASINDPKVQEKLVLEAIKEMKAEGFNSYCPWFNNVPFNQRPKYYGTKQPAQKADAGQDTGYMMQNDFIIPGMRDEFNAARGSEYDLSAVDIAPNMSRTQEIGLNIADVTKQGIMDGPRRSLQNDKTMKVGVAS